MACLVFSDTTGKQAVYPLDRDQLRIGRSTDNDLVASDLRVSRYHASIKRDGDGTTFTIRDEASSMGVFVNQRRVTEAELHDGDTIRLGDTLYSFVDAPDTPLDTLSNVGSQAPSDAGLRGGALVAELRESFGSLSKSVNSPDADPHIVNQCLSLVEERLESLQQQMVRIERARMMMQTLYEVGEIINSSYERANFLEIILDLAVRVVRAERGFLTLYDQSSGAFTRRAAINMTPVEGEEDPGETKDFSTGIALSVARSGKPIVTTDAQSDERFKERQSVVDLKIRSALCVPLVDRAKKVMGVIYVDTRALVVVLGPEDREFLMAFANYASIAIENATLFTEAAAKARMEEELLQARKLDEMKSDLISIVSHDIRTPLTSIKSYAEILHDDLETLEPAEQRHFLDIINNEADRLSRLVTNYLDLQKIEANMMRLTTDSLEVAGLVEEGICSFQGSAREKEVTLRREMEASLPAIKGDRDRLMQVLANLLSNGIKFTPRGGTVTVTARTTDLPGRGPAVELAVRDTGEGVPPDKIDSLFRRFSQIGEGRSIQKRGTGLGLVFSREIVELHGGRIGVESTSGSGASFVVVLPVAGP